MGWGDKKVGGSEAMDLPARIPAVEARTIEREESGSMEKKKGLIAGQGTEELTEHPVFSVISLRQTTMTTTNEW